eukprot:SAG11_NODE_13756_length_641_cov_0.881919_2_plen_44_part_01
MQSAVVPLPPPPSDMPPAWLSVDRFGRPIALAGMSEEESKEERR